MHEFMRMMLIKMITEAMQKLLSLEMGAAKIEPENFEEMSFSMKIGKKETEVKMDLNGSECFVQKGKNIFLSENDKGDIKPVDFSKNIKNEKKETSLKEKTAEDFENIDDYLDYINKKNGNT